MNTNILLEENLDRLRHEILNMASHVEEDLSKALSALRNNDVALAKEVKSNDKTVNAMQTKIEDETAMLLATQSPVAADLRELVSIFKITGNLERIGDYTVHLARSAIKFSKDPPYRPMEHIENMAEKGKEMLRMSISAFLNHDSETARKAADMDSYIDEEHKLLTQEVLVFIKEKKAGLKKSIRLLNTSNYLERLGDHITNICECIIYMVEVKHERLNK